MTKTTVLFVGLFLSAITVISCINKSDAEKETVSAAGKPISKTFAPSDLFQDDIVDGFVFPFGDGKGGGSYKGYKDGKTYNGWYIATKTGEKYDLGIHTGEDWNGVGGGDSELGQPVYSTASGEVIDAKDYGAPWGNVVYVKHRFIENTKIKTVFSLYAHLNELKVKKGDKVIKRQQVGTVGTGHNSFPAHLHFEIRKENMENFETTYWPSSNDKDADWVLEHYEEPSAFIKDHKKTPVPKEKELLIVAMKHEYKMYVYKKGTLHKTYPIALSQSPIGHKQKEGDNKLPEGAYKIIQKTEGPFGGDYSEFLGPRFMRLNYPNNFDAKDALKRKAITKKQCEQICTANNTNKEPNKNTGIGGGIGIHGWAGEWPADTKHLTWGCISMKNKQLTEFYDLIPLYT
ncbi:MAG TPA: peptidoglycan DD-metalloendopeptidase family protein, partial [Bacteroidia bacterium]